jgi:hypothetical protein
MFFDYMVFKAFKLLGLFDVLDMFVLSESSTVTKGTYFPAVKKSSFFGEQFKQDQRLQNASIKNKFSSK